MDTERFDHLSRTLAVRHTRRRALTHAGRGGALAALGVALGIGRLPATAQGNQSDTCTLQLTASFLVGPNQDSVLEGEVTFELGEGGAIDDGQLVTVDEATFDLVGQATGRAINLRIETGDGHLTFLGVAQQDVILCRGAMAGTFGGPDAGSLGTWFAGPSSEQGNQQGGTNGQAAAAPVAAAVAAAPAVPTVPPGRTSESLGGGGGETTTPDPCATSPACGPTADGGTFVHDPVTCACGCPPASIPCGQACCPAGVACEDASINDCACDNSQLCKGNCVPLCLDDRVIDPVSCECVLGAGQNGAPIGSGLCAIELCVSYPGTTANDVKCEGLCVCEYHCPAVCTGGKPGTYFTIACSVDPATVCENANCL